MTHNIREGMKFVFLVCLCSHLCDTVTARSITIKFRHTVNFAAVDEEVSEFIQLPAENEAALRYLTNVSRLEQRNETRLNAADDPGIKKAYNDADLTSDETELQGNDDDQNDVDGDDNERSLEMLTASNTTLLGKHTMSRDEIRHRKPRSAHEQWRNARPGASIPQSMDSSEDEWLEVTDEELKKGERQAQLKLLKYIGITLASVAGFGLLAFFFLKDPIAFVIAVGTGCPCCLLCCCCLTRIVRAYNNPGDIMKKYLNKYMPGIVIMDDGSFKHYIPSQEEIDLVAELYEEMEGGI